MSQWVELTIEKLDSAIFDESTANGTLIFKKNHSYFLISTKNFDYSMHSVRLIFNNNGNLVILYK